MAKVFRFANKSVLDEALKSKKEILSILQKNDKNIKCYGVRIDRNNPDPYERVTYIMDAYGKRPAKMNYDSGSFDYGDWEDVWFVKENYPVMLKSNGTEDYRLDPNDYSKKWNSEDDSEIEYTGYDGNVMSRIPLVWVHFSQDANYDTIIVADGKYDDSYHAIAHTKEDGTIVEQIYLSCYQGSLNNDSTKLQSISGQYPMMTKTAIDEITYATENGSGWYTRTWGQRQLINTLLLIMSKSEDSQTSFGNGAYTTRKTGGLNTGGQFIGYNDDTHQVKVFHIEDWWGNIMERIA
jgi:hypothetical protein